MNIFSPVYTNAPTFLIALLCIAVAIVLATAFSISFIKFKTMDGYHKDTAITFIILPVVISGIVLGVTAAVYNFDGSETTARYARVAAALLSAVLILKIRSNQRTPEEITYYLFLTGLSLLIGLGYLLYAVILFVIVEAVFVVIHLLHFPTISKRRLSLRIKVPEDMNYEHLFDDLFAQYCDKYELKMVKTTDLGTIFSLKYEVLFKADVSQKEFVDHVRERNSNLDVSLVSALFEAKEK